MDLPKRVEIYEEAYRDYRDQCQAIACMNPSTNWGKGGVEERYKIAFFTALDLAFTKAKEQDRSKIDETGQNITLENEKRRRVYYQDIVYAVCISLERALGMHDKIVVGTIDEPSTETQAKIEELSKIKFMQEAEINDLRACIKCEKMPEGYDVNDDATTELAVELAKSQLETSCMVEDAVHKADLLRVATVALEDIRATCISSPYWYNQVSHAPARLQNVTRALLRHHKIATDAQVKIAELSAIEYGDDVDVEHG